MKKLRYRYPIYALCAVFLLSAFDTIRQLIMRMGTELMRVYTWDTPIYYAVGRGLLNGLKPYTDLFETKPPGIFFLAACSLAIDGDMTLGNVLCFLCLCLLTIVPVVLTVRLLWKKQFPLLWKLFLPICIGFVSILVMLYSQLRSGFIQVEAFGSCFLVLYLAVILLMKPEQMKPYSPSIFLAALFVMIAVMFKEPFLIIAIAAALLFIRSGRELLYRLVLPLVYGGAMGVLLLLCTGTLVPYLTTYLPYMTGGHVSIYGSPFLRALRLDKLVHDAGSFSALFQGILILLTILTGILLLRRAEGELGKSRTQTALAVWDILKLPVLLYLVSFTVGLGGQYYNHHFIFAVPFYLGMLLFILKALADSLPQKEEEPASLPASQQVHRVLPGAISILAVMACVGMTLLPDYAPHPTILGENEKMRTEAAYVDQMLDTLGEERYQFVGFNGHCFYAFTEHSPLGPVFFQDPNTMPTDDTWFAEQLKLQLEQANVLIVQRVNANAMSSHINRVISLEFTNKLPDGLTEPPDVFGYQIYFRKGAFPGV